MFVSPKKSLGQHFLIDHNIAKKIISSLPAAPSGILEIGPGTGILTKYILENPAFEPMFIETDREAVEYLNSVFSEIGDKLIHDDFLKVDLKDMLPDNYQIVGNLPYNISSQIFFRMLDERDRLASAVVMIQKEVAERIRSGPGSKVYGILSVLLQTWFDVEYLFTVSENVFKPRPRVKSAVIRLTRNTSTDIGCEPGFYFKVVKTAFNQRRKTLRNALKPFLADKDTSEINELLSKRAEQLSVEKFILLANHLL